MRDITEIVYTFSELQDEVQLKLIEARRYQDFDDSYWYQPIYENFIRDAEKYGFTDIKPYFSLSNSQGDGACFDGKIDVKKMVNYLVEQDTKFEKLLEDEILDTLTITIRRNGHATFYSHSKTRYIESGGDNLPNTDNIDRTITILYQDLCKHLEKDLQTEMDYITSDEYIKDWLMESDFEFYSNGREYEG